MGATTHESTEPSRERTGTSTREGGEDVGLDFEICNHNQSNLKKTLIASSAELSEKLRQAVTCWDDLTRANERGCQT